MNIFHPLFAFFSSSSFLIPLLHIVSTSGNCLADYCLPKFEPSWLVSVQSVMIFFFIMNLQFRCKGCAMRDLFWVTHKQMKQIMSFHFVGKMRRRIYMQRWMFFKTSKNFWYFFPYICKNILLLAALPTLLIIAATCATLKRLNSSYNDVIDFETSTVAFTSQFFIPLLIVRRNFHAEFCISPISNSDLLGGCTRLYQEAFKCFLEAPYGIRGDAFW